VTPVTAAARASETGRTVDLRPGLIASLLVLCVYGGLALSVDFPRDAFGFQSDEATYYMITYSLVRDHDLEYRRADLERVWHEFPAGPTGVFLKTGRSVSARVNAAFPFVHVRYGADPDNERLYYGKSFIYPLVAAPFVWLLGTNGFLFLHAILLALAIFCGYLFLEARMRSDLAAVVASGFFLASIVPGYMVWTTPELFNLVIVTVAGFCWLYKEVAPLRLPGWMTWLRTSRSDLLAGVLLGIATFSKPTNVLFAAPMLGVLVQRKRLGRAMTVAAVVCGVAGMFYFVNLLSSGDWNFQGGQRNTFYGPFPFQTPQAGFDIGVDKVTDIILTHIIFDPKVFWSRLAWNLVYFVLGRNSGMLPYFFPGLFALLAFLWPGRPRHLWQWLIVAVAAVEVVLFAIWIPYDYFGGGGVIGNRYFMNTYGLLLFLMPPLESLAAAVVPWAIGALFTARIALNPFYSAFNPASHTESGPQRLLPVEMTLLNNLPITTRIERVRVWFGTAPRFQVYFLDDNAYPREGESFWVRGNSRTDLVVKAVDQATRLRLRVNAGSVPVRVAAKIGGESVSKDLAAGEAAFLELTLPEGFPYQGARAWSVTLSVSGGFVPMFADGSRDNRFLGVMVKPELVP
jgi:hypothetical protein